MRTFDRLTIIESPLLVEKQLHYWFSEPTLARVTGGRCPALTYVDVPAKQAIRSGDALIVHPVLAAQLRAATIPAEEWNRPRFFPSRIGGLV